MESAPSERPSHGWASAYGCNVRDGRDRMENGVRERDQDCVEPGTASPPALEALGVSTVTVTGIPTKSP